MLMLEVCVAREQQETRIRLVRLQNSVKEDCIAGVAGLQQHF